MWEIPTILVCAVAVGVALIRAVRDGEAHDPDWGVDDAAGELGSRADIAELSGSMAGSWGTIGSTAEIRVRKLARRRLELEGIDLRDPRQRQQATQRLGAPLVRLLERENVIGLRPSTAIALLDALDAIDRPSPGAEVAHD